jgi:hypothetical protein
MWYECHTPNVVLGVVFCLEVWGKIMRAFKARKFSILSVYPRCCRLVPGDQVDGKIPNPLALATAWVRLWTISLPYILRV